MLAFMFLVRNKHKFGTSSHVPYLNLNLVNLCALVASESLLFSSLDDTYGTHNLNTSHTKKTR